MSLDYELLESAYNAVKTKWPDTKPKCGIVLGSGWSEVVESFEVKGEMGYGDIPGLGKTGVVGHAGKLAWATGSGLETLIFQGRRHFYEGEGWTPAAVPLYVLKKFGAEIVILTNAAGGIRSDMKPGDLMCIDDHLNNMPTNPLIGKANEIWGPRFPDQSEVYNKALRAKMDAAANELGEKLFHGVYLASVGPTYETPAEIIRYKNAGADAVGMSTIPEAILANASGMKVAGISCITNLAAGISPQPLTHEEVTESTKNAMPRMKALLAAYWKQLAQS